MPHFKVTFDNGVIGTMPAENVQEAIKVIASIYNGKNGVSNMKPIKFEIIN